MFKLGKKPARNLMKLKFSDVVNAHALPTPPLTFGRKGLVPTWHGLGNDRYSNCVWAGAAHETMLATVQGGQPRARFTMFDVNESYSVVTGFDPADPKTDEGTDMLDAASYRKKVGIRDATNVRHTVDTFAALRAGDVGELVAASWVTGGVGVGVMLPTSAMDQFDQGQPWDVVKRSKIEGGHYVCVYDRAPNGNLICVTFGQDQEMTPEFYAEYNDESVAYLMLDRLSGGKSPEAFDLDALRRDILVM